MPAGARWRTPNLAAARASGRGSKGLTTSERAERRAVAAAQRSRTCLVPGARSGSVGETGLGRPPRRAALSLFYLSPVSPRGGPRAPPTGTPDGTQHHRPAPTARTGRPAGTHPTRPPSSGGRRGVQCPRDSGSGPGRPGRPGVCRLGKNNQTRCLETGRKQNKTKSTTLSGGSLGSCVDEERS